MAAEVPEAAGTVDGTFAGAEHFAKEELELPVVSTSCSAPREESAEGIRRGLELLAHEQLDPEPSERAEVLHMVGPHSGVATVASEETLASDDQDMRPVAMKNSKEVPLQVLVHRHLHIALYLDRLDVGREC